MLKTVRGQRIDTVFVLIIFCVFAVSVLMVLMLGANTYSSVTEMSREEHAERTVLSYIWTKVRNSDDGGNIYVGDFQGLPALCISEEYGGIEFRTVIYHFNGWVYELFSEADLEFFPEDGVKMIMVNDLVYEDLEHGLIMISSGTRKLLLSPRSSAVELGYFDGFGEEVFPG